MFPLYFLYLSRSTFIIFGTYQSYVGILNEFPTLQPGHVTSSTKIHHPRLGQEVGNFILGGGTPDLVGNVVINTNLKA